MKKYIFLIFCLCFDFYCITSESKVDKEDDYDYIFPSKKLLKAAKKGDLYNVKEAIKEGRWAIDHESMYDQYTPLMLAGILVNEVIKNENSYQEWINFIYKHFKTFRDYDGFGFEWRPLAKTHAKLIVQLIYWIFKNNIIQDEEIEAVASLIIAIKNENNEDIAKLVKKVIKDEISCRQWIDFTYKYFGFLKDEPWWVKERKAGSIIQIIRNWNFGK